VILFDEIEKAHPRVLDRLMSVIDDGRIADAQGRVTYFREAVIVMTSNLGSTELASRSDFTSMTEQEINELFVRASREYFQEIGRPEIWGRLEAGVVPFQPLNTNVVAQIVNKTLDGFCFESGPEVNIDRDSAVKFVEQVMADPVNRRLGGRRIRNVLRERFLHLARRLTTEPLASSVGPEDVVHVRFSTDGEPQIDVRHR
jgi:ATP-dependent Clp protease ATP-binding subunit ClpB